MATCKECIHCYVCNLKGSSCRDENEVIFMVDSVKAERSCEEYLPSDIAPVRHGHWKNISESDMSKTVMCSVCNKMFYFTKKGQLNIDMVPYCPNCGAKMEEVEQ